MNKDIRQIDVLGRIAIPIEFRKALNIKTTDHIEILLDKDHEQIILKKEN